MPCSFDEPRAADPSVVAVLAGATVVDKVQIAVGQLSKASRMLIRVREFRSKNAFVEDLVAAKPRTGARQETERDNKNRNGAKSHASRSLSDFGAVQNHWRELMLGIEQRPRQSLFSLPPTLFCDNSTI